MLVIAQERQPRAPVARGRRVGQLDHPGAAHHPGRAVGVGFDHRVLGVVVGQHHVGGAHHLELGGAGQRRRRDLFGIVGGQAGAQLAQEMQIGVVEQDLRRRRMGPDRRDHALRHRIAGDVDGVELGAALFDEIHRRQAERRVDHLHAHPFQVLGIASQMRQVHRQEGHLEAQRPDQPDLLQRGITAGIAIGPRRGMVDHQHAPVDAAVLFQVDIDPVRAVAAEGAAQRRLNFGRLSSWKRLKPAPVSVPEVIPS